MGHRGEGGSGLVLVATPEGESTARHQHVQKRLPVLPQRLPRACRALSRWSLVFISFLGAFKSSRRTLTKTDGRRDPETENTLRPQCRPCCQQAAQFTAAVWCRSPPCSRRCLSHRGTFWMAALPSCRLCPRALGCLYPAPCGRLARTAGSKNSAPAELPRVDLPSPSTH